MGESREDLKLEVVREILGGKISKRMGIDKLGIKRRSLNRYLKRFLEEGKEGLKDKRRGNNKKLSPKDEKRIVFCKLYRVPYDYIKARVWVKLRGDTLFIECGKKTIAKHKLIP